MTITVIIPTYNRPECVRANLTRLLAQSEPPEQTIVVDASPDDRTGQVAAEFAGVVYLRNPGGRGNTPNSRNLALKHAEGDILAFLDDDAFVHDGWAENLRRSYTDPSLGGVAGRALNGQPGEENTGLDAIGKFLPDGRLTGNFAADPGRVVEVDHMIGCNMSMRGSVVAQLGGFRDDMPPGPFGICEETELCIRAKRLGYRLIFNPQVCADHVGALQPGGRRFSPKYGFYHAKNNFVMVIRNYGVGTLAMRHVLAIARQSGREFARKVGGALAHLICSATGLAAGFVVGVYWRSRTGLSPVRSDAEGRLIGSKLNAAQVRQQERSESPVATAN